MKRLSNPDTICKTAITTLVVVSFLMLPKVGFLPVGAEDFSPLYNVVFIACHANIFHLLCNVICVWQIRCINRFVLPAVAVSFFCSFLPEISFSPFDGFLSVISQPIMGLSGVLFAIIGIKFGMYSSFRVLAYKVLPYILITAFLPNVAVLFHIYCLALGFLLGFLSSLYSLWKKVSCI